MTVRKILTDVVVEQFARIRDGAKQTFGDEGADRFSLRIDTSTTPSALVVDDEINGGEMARIGLSNDVPSELEAGGTMELTIGNLLDFDPTEVIIDTRANQPAAGTPNRVMLITDEGSFEYDTGASWVPMGSTASTLSQGGVDELAVESLASGGAASSVPTADGAGGLTMETPSGSVPADGIVIWSGSISSIPGGWVLCDGNNGTPNLLDRFVVGAGNSYAVGATGGSQSNSLSSSQMPSHGHSVSDPGHNHRYYLGYGSDPYPAAAYDDDSRDPNTDPPTSSETTGISLGDAGSGSSIENRPPYFAQAYIMNA